MEAPNNYMHPVCNINGIDSASIEHNIKSEMFHCLYLFILII